MITTLVLFHLACSETAVPVAEPIDSGLLEEGETARPDSDDDQTDDDGSGADDGGSDDGGSDDGGSDDGGSDDGGSTDDGSDDGSTGSGEDTGATESDDTGDAEVPNDDDGDGYDVTTDCDDADATIHPDAAEACNGLDDDCDGLADEGLTIPVWYQDDDGDGYGLSDVDTISCEPVEGFASMPGDCDDADAAVSPGTPEVCDQLDQDCDGVADDGLATLTGYLDLDGDGFGTTVLERCDLPDGYVLDDGDCDDLDVDINPGAVDACNDGIDNDCDGALSPSCHLEGDYDVEAADGVVTGSDEDGEYGRGMSMGDADGNGTQDLVVVAPFAKGEDSFGVTHEAGGVIYGMFEGSFESHDAGDAHFTYVGTVDGDLEDATVLVRDLDGDGYDDLSVGIPSDSWTDLSGQVHMFWGPRVEDEVLDNYVAIIEGEKMLLGESSARLGSSLASAGDVDGDGHEDFVVGADHADYDGNNGVGAVYLLAGPVGSSLDLSTDATASLYGDDEGVVDQAIGGGDLDGDGLDDLVLTASGADSGTLEYCGIVAVFEGPVAGEMTIESADTRIAGLEHSYLGTSVAIVPDLDGDGYDDLFAGAPSDATAGSRAGAAYAWEGPFTGGELDTTDALASWTGDRDNAVLGSSVAAADVDGDGNVDFLMGAPGVPSASSNKGYVQVSYGPVAGAYTEGDASFTGEAADDEAGASVFAQDLDADGHAEIVIGAPGFDDGYDEEAGRVYVWSGLGL